MPPVHAAHLISSPTGVLHIPAQPVVGRRGLAVILGGLNLLGPLSIDAYLPAFADIQRDFQASTADLQLTLPATCSPLPA